MNQNEVQTPHSIEAEQSLLGALLLDNDAVDRMGDVRIEHLYRGEHRVIFAEIKRQITAGKRCDVISVGIALGDQVADCMPYLNSLAQNTPSAANIGRYAEIVRDRALRRGLIAETSRLADLAFNPAGKTASEVLDVAQGAIAALAETRALREPVRASEAMVAHVDVLEARTEGKTSGIPTGLAGIDALLNGGPNRGNLVILGARPSMGKTALSLNIAANVARDHGVLFLSQEMGIAELLDRTIAFLGRVSLSAVLGGQMDAEDWTGFTAGTAKLNNLNLHLDEQPALTLLDVRAKARLVKRQHGLDLLVVDYLQLMSGEGQNRNSQLEEISRGLKALAKELNIVVMALSQLSRNAANMSRPKLSDLRDSGAIEQDADIVMFLHRDEVDNPSTHLRGIADVFIAKNRQGRIDDVMLGYEGTYTAFADFNGQRPAQQQKEYKRGLARDL
jgi:replicative DNA helicase